MLTIQNSTDSNQTSTDMDNINLYIDTNYDASESSVDQIVPHSSPVKIDNIEGKIEEYMRIWAQLGGTVNTDGPSFEQMLTIAKAQQKCNKLVRNSVISKSTGSIHNKMPKIEEKSEEERKSRPSAESSITDLSSRKKYVGIRCRGASRGDMRSESFIDRPQHKDSVMDKHTPEVGSDSNRNVNDTNLEIQNLRKQLDAKTKELDDIMPRFQFLEEHFEGFLLIKADYLKLKNEQFRTEHLKKTENRQQNELAEKNLEPNNSIDKFDKFTQTLSEGYAWINVETWKENDAFFNKEMSTQTWDSALLCNQCTKTLSLLDNPRLRSALKSKDDKVYCIMNSEMVDLQEKFRILKKSISEREFVYEKRKETAQIFQLKTSNAENRAKILELENKLDVSKTFADVLQGIIHKFPIAGLYKLKKQEQRWVEIIKTKSLKTTKTELMDL